MLPAMETEAHTTMRPISLVVRLHGAGRAVSPDGRVMQPPATWRVIRCWPQSRGDWCLVPVTVDQRTYYATVTEEDLAKVAVDDGVLVWIERYAKASVADRDLG